MTFTLLLRWVKTANQFFIPGWCYKIIDIPSIPPFFLVQFLMKNPHELPWLLNGAIPKVWNRLEEKSFVQWEDRWCTRVAEKLSQIGSIWLRFGQF